MSHSHHHKPKNYNRAFAVGVTLNIAFVAIEIVYGLSAGSLALIADAGHNLSDVIGLVLAWGASLLASRQPTPHRTYGFRRITILASLTSAVLLLLAMGAIGWEAIGRINTPNAVDSQVIIVVAAIGVVINGFTALMFASGHKHDLNIKGAFLHMVADAAISSGVVVIGVLILYTGMLWLDPVISIVIVCLILIGTWGLLRDSVSLLIDSVPRNIDPHQVDHYFRDLPDVADLHDLHIWAMSTTEVALTVHLVIPNYQADDIWLQDVSRQLHELFGIHHVTVQIERTDDGLCPQAHPGSV